MNSNIIAYSLVAAMLALAFLFASGVLKIPGSSSSSKTAKDPGLTRPDAFIKPTPFKAGYIKNSPQKLANLCKDDYGGVKNLGDFNNIKYPINPVYVDYGGKKIPDDCKCLQFIQAP
jgi:hypothetical protein